MPQKTVNKGQLPERYRRFQRDYPAVSRAHEQLGKAATAAGPLSAKTRELVRLAIAIGSRREGAVHSHTRRAREVGLTPAEIRHAVLLGITSLGFSSTMAVMSWVDDVLNQ